MAVELEDEPGTANMGLSKSIFFKFLQSYGVILQEQEKALISTVFGCEGNLQGDKLDYEKIDNAFEGVQQQLYAQGKYNIKPARIELAFSFSKPNSIIVFARVTIHS